MRQSKALKICASHLEHIVNEKSCVWHATDGELKEQLFCVRFASTESCCINVWGNGTFFGVGVSYLQTKLDA
ncbi:hypothetical protein MKW92_052266, partial [Papaver armeniacum]